MRHLFGERISKFGSLISLILLTVLLSLFSLVLPEFLSSSTGRIFAMTWALTAIVIFMAHSRRITEENYGRHNPYIRLIADGKKDARTRKVVRSVRAMRG